MTRMPHKQRTLIMINRKTASFIVVLLAQSFVANANVVATLEHQNMPGNVTITVTYSNGGTSPVSIPVVDIPKTGEDGKLRGDALHIRGIDGSIPPYTGYRVSYPRAALTQRLVIRPGEFLTRTIIVSKNYDLHAGMTYDITPRSFRQSDTDAAPGRSGRLHDTDTIVPTLRITAPSGGIPKPAPNVQDGERIPTETACTIEQFLTVTNAQAVSLKMAVDAYSYLSSLYTEKVVNGEIRKVFNQTPRYASWFGNHGDPNDPNPVNARIRTLVEVAASRHSKVSLPSCECSEQDQNDGVIAWVVATSPHVINYCPAFFKLPVGPNVATGSQAATIYHEITHFTDALAKGTSDLDEKFASPPEARYLATSARDLAADHAYSFEYFADNFANEE